MVRYLQMASDLHGEGSADVELSADGGDLQMMSDL